MNTKTLLRHMSVPEEPDTSGIYILGCFEKRVTVCSQQIRALNLVYSLFSENYLNSNSKIAVVGGGISGLTAAAAAARKGCQVTLFETGSKLIPLLDNCQTRWLHPYLYEWPQGSFRELSSARDLPIMNWKSGRVAEIVKSLREQWDEIAKEYKIKIITSVRDLKILSKPEKEQRKITWNPGAERELYDIVILAVGYGLEKEFPPLSTNSYWHDNRLHQVSSSPERVKRYLISGCGDGGLADLLRARIDNFTSDEVVHGPLFEILSNNAMKDVIEQLVNFDKEAEKKQSPEAQAAYLTDCYRALTPPDTLDAELKRRLRKDTKVVLNGPKTDPFSLDASILNRFLVSRLLFGLKDVDYWHGIIPEGKIVRLDTENWEVMLESGDKKSFHEVIIRHGTEPALKAFPWLWTLCEKPLKSRNQLDQSREPLWTAGWFDSAQPLVPHASPSRAVTVADKTIRKPPIPKAIVGLGIPSKEAWLKLLELLRLIDGKSTCKIVSDNQKQGLLEIAVHINDTRQLVKCIGGRGHSISVHHVNEENARLDDDEYSSITVVSFGDIESEARQKALRLLAKGKKLRFLAKDQLVEEINRNLPERISKAITQLDGSTVELSSYIAEEGIGVIVKERLRSEWFYVISPEGMIFASADPTVQKIRVSQPELAKLLYRGEPQGIESSHVEIVPFDDVAYREKCLAEFDDIRYDPLAAVGIRFSNAKLRDVYVPASADIGLSADKQQLDGITDYLDSLQLGEKQRIQLEAQVREFISVNSSKETNAARLLYQNHNNLLVLGDPGSGKTCFVKNEILTYCKPPINGGSWYKSHIPVFIPLVEVAALLEKEDSFLQICAVLIEQQALPMQRQHLDQLAAEGRLAFFFDGLDEVSSVEQRVQIIEALGVLLTELAPQGNRLVITSRPAAIQLIELPHGLATLTLCGLTDAEIRLLTTKILTLRLVADETEAKLIDRHLNRDEEELVTRLLADCKANPGLHRIATNPLLLTLLVMTYASSGPFAAKRHRIYENAVRTLVSIRNREHDQQVQSEADLRYRLGYLAYTVFGRKVTDLPVRKEIVALFSEAIKKERAGRLNESAVIEESEQFLQQIAESTGLLRIHQRTTDNGEDSVTFMHYSFLEYYAAVGCATVEKLEASKIAELAKHSRWQETITLCAGLVSDHADVTPLLEELAKDRSPADHIIKANLLFAFDCALECDVPPDEAQRRLLEATDVAIGNGPGLVDPEFRQLLGERIGKLLASTRSRRILDMLAQGIGHQQPNVAAAFVDLAGRVGALAKLDKRILDAYEQICDRAERGEQVIQAAIFGAIARCKEFRTAKALDLLKKGLRSSSPNVKLYAAQTIEIEPSLASHSWNELVLCLDDTSPLVTKTAARAILEGGLSVNMKDDNPGRAILEKCLRHWEKTTKPESLSSSNQDIDRRLLEEHISSGNSNKAALAIRLLPWYEKEEGRVYRTLIKIIRDSKDHFLLATALSALRRSKSTIAMLTVADAEFIGELTKNPNRDVRLAACRTLAALPKQDLTVSELLLDYVKRSEAREAKEFTEAMRALVSYAKNIHGSTTRDFIFRMISEELGRVSKSGFGDSNRQLRLRRMLVTCEELGRPVRAEILGQIKALISNYKTPENLRRHALRAFAHSAVPSKKTGEYILELIKTGSPSLGGSLGLAVREFVRACKQKIEYVRESQDCLERMQNELIQKWDRIDLPKIERIDDRAIQSIRLALRDIHNLLAAFTEFKEHKRVVASS